MDFNTTPLFGRKTGFSNGNSSNSSSNSNSSNSNSNNHDGNDINNNEHTISPTKPLSFDSGINSASKNVARLQELEDSSALFIARDASLPSLSTQASNESFNTAQSFEPQQHPFAMLANNSSQEQQHYYNDNTPIVQQHMHFDNTTPTAATFTISTPTEADFTPLGDLNVSQDSFTFVNRYTDEGDETEATPPDLQAPSYRTLLAHNGSPFQANAANRAAVLSAHPSPARSVGQSIVNSLAEAGPQGFPTPARVSEAYQKSPTKLPAEASGSAQQEHEDKYKYKYKYNHQYGQEHGGGQEHSGGHEHEYEHGHKHNLEPIRAHNTGDSTGQGRLFEESTHSHHTAHSDGTTHSHDETFSHTLSSAASAPDHGVHLGKGGVDMKTALKRSSELCLDDQNLAYLFIVAVHSFNIESLENREDASICLSFEKNDIAFVHTVDESGWGEVTLLRTRKRGWVPFNYFSDTVKHEQRVQSTEPLAAQVESRKPLEKLLSSAAKFLLHPQDYPLPDGSGMSFRPEYINGIRDGVKHLLAETDCISRSTDLVKSKPAVKRARKRLLADWYNLMIKADSYKHSAELKRIETLRDLVFEVLLRAMSFYDTWGVEKQVFERERVLGTGHQRAVPNLLGNGIGADTTAHLGRCKPVDRDDMPYLPQPPSAIARLHEVHELSFSYIGLILGRLDMIEHNPTGCEVLEYLVHQIILLLRELLYISKSCSSIIHAKYRNEYENNLDHNLDPLLSLVSELVSCIKVFVTQTISESYDESAKKLLVKDDLYYYTDEGDRLLGIVSKMTWLISNAISGCNSYLRLVGDFELGPERKYPDFERVKITPEQFIKKCSTGLVTRLDKDKALSSLISSQRERPEHTRPSKRFSRFSTIRSGQGAASLTSAGTQLLQDFLPDDKPLLEDSTFDSFRLAEGDSVAADGKDAVNNRRLMQDELMFDKQGVLIGASFRALVFMLTDELNKPDDFLVSTVLLNFKSFAKGVDLVEQLIARFDVTGRSAQYEVGERNGQYSSRASRLKNRRRMVCKVFRTWMESFWDYRHDYALLATAINFFNEGVSVYLPIEARTLIEVAAKLAAATPNTRTPAKRDNLQLVPRNIIGPNTLSVVSTRSSLSSVSSSSSSSRASTRHSTITVDEQMIEEYELTKMPTNTTSSISLPLPLLSLGTSSLLTKRNINDMERLVAGYRSMVGLAANTGGLVPETNLGVLLQAWSGLIAAAGTQAPPRNLVHNDLNLAELNPLEVSKQLSLIESKLFLSITASELLHENFMPKKAHLHQASNVGAILSFTNLLSSYVIESIVGPGFGPKKRTGRLRSWMKIALSALYFRNFNSVAAIMTALQSHVVSRLSPLWSSLSSKDTELFEYLSKIVHPNNNYKVYRNKLKKLTDEYAVHGMPLVKSMVPVVPFFNLFLQDITFINEGNTNFRNPDSFRPNKLINIDKYFKITRTVSLIQFLQVGYEVDGKPNFTGSRRDSFFNIGGSIDVDTKSITPVPLLQEFILYEFWRVSMLYANDHDRGYNLSLQLVPKAG